MSCEGGRARALQPSRRSTAPRSIHRHHPVTSRHTKTALKTCGFKSQRRRTTKPGQTQHPGINPLRASARSGP
ncbi:hypothetical protein XarbCFBP7629_20575 [Xanthomonas arboricola]|nr:hypothetical protein XarbCFBP7629_20575 [Xanthomonas arboricola]